MKTPKTPQDSTNAKPQTERTDMIPGTFPPLPIEEHDRSPELAQLAELAHDATPPDALWDRIDTALDKEVVAPGITAIRSGEGTWQAYPDGVWKKVLTRRPDGVEMYLVRCEPGARIAGHHHKSVEQVFVLEGNFVMNGVSFSAGDGQFAAANTDHPEIFSENGCLLLIVA